MPTTTTNYSLNKPLVNDPTDADQWGTQLNTNMDTIDTTMKSISDSTYSNTSAKTANYTVVAADRNDTILVDATAGAITITLTAAATLGNGFEVTIKKTDSSANIVTIDANASETIDGATTKTITAQYNLVTLVCDGTNWQIKGIKEVVSTVPNSYVRVGTVNGCGSTNTAIRRFTTTIASAGTDITYADSATNGASFTINTTGIYAISYSDNSNINAMAFGISKNSTQLTTSIASITAADRLKMTYTANNANPTNVSVTLPLTAADVIRPHNDGTTTNGTAALSSFTITRIA